ncbi:hypothetical protein CTI12_AA612030 [Artemisia annua]|uniref:Uncharacterized protein n=1 Tax=Artemisia annua TaxID=35608 RepID=A0A2U1KEG6_ARTAN|nr:hypothetical protein CTI12_AA612030 [Artemisia annua]
MTNTLSSGSSASSFKMPDMHHPTGPMFYAIISDANIVDNPDIKSYQPHVHGRCNPPALIPLHMHGISMDLWVCGACIVLQLVRVVIVLLQFPLGEKKSSKMMNQKTVCLVNTCVGFGNLKATTSNQPPGMEDVNLNEAAKIVMKVASTCYGICGSCFDLC